MPLRGHTFQRTLPPPMSSEASDWPGKMKREEFERSFFYARKTYDSYEKFYYFIKNCKDIYIFFFFFLLFPSDTSNENFPILFSWEERRGGGGMNLLQATVRRESERWCKRDVRPWWAPKCIDSRGTSLALLAAVRKGGKKRWQNLAGCRSTSVPVIKSRDSSARELVCNRKSEGKRSGGKSKMAWRAGFARARWSSSVLLEVVPVPCTGLSSCSKK